MKNIQIENIIIWAKNPNLKPRILTFSMGKVNIIHGLSQTGKSAIIPIIDYCLGSTQNKIPVGHIREYSAFFGIVLNISGIKVLLARENLDESSKKIIVLEDMQKIPENLDITKEQSIDEFKINFNKIMGVPFCEPKYSMGMRNARLSFRDLVTFNFQPQYIVANPNCLLYKMDVSKYKNLIIPVFNLIIGAETLENIENRNKLDELKKQLEELQKNNANYQKNKDRQLERATSIISKAIKYGLLDAKYTKNIKDVRDYKKILQIISQKTIRDLAPSLAQADSISDLLNDLNNEITPLNNKLISLQTQKEYIERLIQLLKERNQSQEIRKDRLEIVQFIRAFCEENSEEISCISDIDEFCSNLDNITKNLNQALKPETALYVKKLMDIDREIYNISSRIEQLKNKILETSKIEREKDIVETIYGDIIIKSKLLLDLANSKDEKLLADINKVQAEINAIQVNDVRRQYKECMDNIIKYGQKYLPDIKEFHYISQFVEDDMTIKVKKEESDEMDFYLWETGSGSNWVAFHIGVLLGFHFHFLERELPMLNFIIYDQPSQVYFPQKLLTKDNNMNSGNDVEQVKKIFKTFEDATRDAKGSLQIIVSDHAGESIWGNIPDKYKHIVANWSDGEALIPKSWYDAK